MLAGPGPLSDPEHRPGYVLLAAKGPGKHPVSMCTCHELAMPGILKQRLFSFHLCVLSAEMEIPTDGKFYFLIIYTSVWQSVVCRLG